LQPKLAKLKQCCGSGSGIWCLFVSWIRDKHPVPGYHISESSETIFWVKILKFFDEEADPEDPGIFKTLDPGSWMENIRIRDPEEKSWIRNTV
jgi:hypothetical protein